MCHQNDAAIGNRPDRHKIRLTTREQCRGAARPGRATAVGPRRAVRAEAPAFMQQEVHQQSAALLQPKLGVAGDERSESPAAKSWGRVDARPQPPNPQL